MRKFWLPLQERAQEELIKRGRCAADGKGLADGERRSYPVDENNENQELVTCSCRRVYVYNKTLNSYRRAHLGEVGSP